VSKEIRVLVFQMVTENPTWGAPRIHGELLKLDFDVSEPTVSRWVRRAPRPVDPTKRWLTFLRNHREAIAAMDFFTVPTLTFGILYCFFVISHDRRRILSLNSNRKCSAHRKDSDKFGIDRQFVSSGFPTASATKTLANCRMSLPGLVRITAREGSGEMSMYSECVFAS
jgi:hypothetical protein